MNNAQIICLCIGIIIIFFMGYAAHYAAYHEEQTVCEALLFPIVIVMIVLIANIAMLIGANF
jgi:hypothetical protein